MQMFLICIVFMRDFNYLALPSLTKTKPAVFTFHDMWAFTGHCAYSYDCDRWKIGCGKCPTPKLHQVLKGMAPLGVEAENWAYSNSILPLPLQVNGWLSRLQSMFNCFPIHHIPYGLDTKNLSASRF